MQYSRSLEIFSIGKRGAGDNKQLMHTLVVFHSTYGHIKKMAEAVAEGAKEFGSVALKRVPETLSPEVRAKMKALSFDDIPVVTNEDLIAADAIIFGTPTRYGNMCGQMSQFIDGTGKLWASGSLVGKVGGVFTSSATQHGGQESTLLAFHTFLFHQGMVVVGLPYAFQGQMEKKVITGCSPYGASCVADAEGEHPSANELDGARFQGRHIAQIAKWIHEGKQ